MVRVLRGRRRARVRTKRDRMSEGMRRRALTGEEVELEEQGHGAARRSIGREFYLYILKKMAVTSMPLKSSIAPVYPNANFFLSMCPSIHLLLDFNSSPALTCGTHPCNCPSYPLAHLLNSHKKKEKTIRPESSCLPNSSRPLPNTPPPPAQYAAAGTGAVAGEVRPTSLRPDPPGSLPSAAQSRPPGPLALCAREAGAGGRRPGHRGAWRDFPATSLLELSPLFPLLPAAALLSSAPLR